MNEIDEILGIIDGGLQSSGEPSYGPLDRSRCWRCTFYPPEDGSSSELCTGCRVFLLGDGPDPRDEIPAGVFLSEADLEVIARAFVEFVETLRPVIERILDVLNEVFRSAGAALEELAKLFDRTKADSTARSFPTPTLPPIRDLRTTEAPRRPPPIRRRTP